MLSFFIELQQYNKIDKVENWFSVKMSDIKV